MNLARIFDRLKVAPPSRKAVSYWGGIAALVVLAGLPFVIFSLSAPTSEIESGGRHDISGSLASGAHDRTAGPTPSVTPHATPMPDPTTIPDSSSAVMGGRVAPDAGISLPPLPPATAATDYLGMDFDLQCWPSINVIPGRSSIVNCDIRSFHGFSGEIALDCVVEAMTCSVGPSKLQAPAGVDSAGVRVRVTAPENVVVGTKTLSISAVSGESGAAHRGAEVRVTVPPPFSMNCESVDVSIAQGSEGALKCWVAFAEGFSDELKLSVVDSGGARVALDISSLTPVPLQTRSFVVDIPAGPLALGDYVVRVEASSARYRQETAASFQVVPAG